MTKFSAFLVQFALLWVQCQAFVGPWVTAPPKKNHHYEAGTTHSPFFSPSSAARSLLLLHESPLDDDAAADTPRHHNDTLVTREMFQRELLADPVVKRKKGRQSTEYKVLDNRDALPFRIENQVPDPYTKKEVKRKNANKVRKRPSSIEEGLKSSLYTDDLSDSDKTMLGDYYLDKHTTTGDLLEIG